jgi:hypothetical protein
VDGSEGSLVGLAVVDTACSASNATYVALRVSRVCIVSLCVLTSATLCAAGACAGTTRKETKKIRRKSEVIGSECVDSYELMSEPVASIFDESVTCVVMHVLSGEVEGGCEVMYETKD